MRKQSFNKPFMVAVVALGAAACVYSAARFPAELLDWRFLLVALVTVCFGSRIGIEVSRVKCQITVSDTFVFLIMLLYGAEAAVLVAAAEAFVSSFRFSRLWLTRFFNGALLACSTFVTAWVVASCFGPVTSLSSGRLNATFVTAVIMMASAQYLCNTSLAAFRESLKIGEPFLATWSNYYLWISITYFGGASAAAITAELIELSGFYAFAVTAPLITVIYFTYRTYRKHIQVTEAQAEQAERHVEELNLHLAEQERIRHALQQSEEHYRNAFEHFRSSFEYAAIGMALLAPDGRWLQVNHSLCKIVGYSEEELLASKWQDITHPDDLGRHLKEMYELVEGKVVTSSSELRYVHREGHDVWAMASASLVRDAQQKPLHVILQLQDITERKRAEGQLHHAAYHDALTGLPNRALFTEHLRVALRRSAEGAENLFAVLFLDLDRFKNINDSLGHVQGDQLLIAVSRRLKQCVRPGDMVARFGGDEFAVLLSSLDCPSDATDIAERVQTAIRSPVHLGGHEVRTAASIGIALSTSGYAQPNDVLRDADTAMYHAKEQGHGHYQVFDRLMHAHVTSLLQRENDLRRAVERAELTLHYQPIVKLATGEITGFEALVRWVHPERGLVPPSDFIPLAEEMGLILPIGWWVLREACEQMRRWQESFHPPEGFDVSVNISAKQF
ncbi:MAG TPA: diguanylate cyclase, partial [Pyrinomonadaceae bacterium]|nr:diguanylate cyclase [Pyrinomonadaceae bacterium]